MQKSFRVVLASTLLAASPAWAQSTQDLLKLSDSLNDMCRDGAGTKTGEACDSRDLVDEILKTRNICFGELGKVQSCKPQDGGGEPNDEGGQGEAPDRPKPSYEQCQRFEENDVIEVKGFVVQYEYAEANTKPLIITAIVSDKPLCFEKEPETKIRRIILDIKSTSLLGRHSRIEMRMIAGDSWSGSVRAISEDKEIPE